MGALPIPRRREVAISLRAGTSRDADALPVEEPAEPCAETRRTTIVAVLVRALPALIMAGLAGWRLTGPALWADELATWGAIRLSWSQLWQLTDNVDVVLRPYYVVAKAWTTMAGTGTIAMRLPSLVAVVATTVLVTELGRRIGGSPTGLAAGLLYAVIPAVSRYAQEARPYAFTMFFAALALWFLLRLTDEPRLGRALAYAAAVAATGLFHPLSAALMLIGHGAAMIVRQVRRRPDGWRVTWLWLAGAALGSMPAMILGVAGVRQAGQVSWIPLVNGNVLAGAPQSVFTSPVVGGAIVVLAVLGIRRSLASVFLIGAGLLPPALLLLAGTGAHIWIGRYALLAVPALAVLAGVGATRVGRPQAVTVVVLLAMFGFPIQEQVRSSAGHYEDSAKIAEVIPPRYQPGDVAVFADFPAGIQWAGRDIYERYLPAPRPPDVLLTRPQRTDGNLLAKECDAAACLGTPPRIWIIRTDTAADPLAGMSPEKKAAIGGQYTEVQRWSYALLDITLMQRNQPPT